MSYCDPPSSSFLYYIDENQLFSVITSITFVTVAIFWYILRSYTFFDNNRITARAVRPTAPFGNIKDVVFQNTSLYVYLWKYYNKFNRRGNKFGGFYLFLKPGLLVVDPDLTYKILTDEEWFEYVDRKNALKGSEKVCEMFDNRVIENLIVKCNNMKNHFTQITKTSGDLTSDIYSFLIQTSCEAFGFKIEENLENILKKMMEEKTSSNFSHYFRLSLYPYFSKKQTYEDLKKYFHAVIESRKKNDTRESDVIQNYIDFAHANGESLETIVVELLDIFVVHICQTYSTVLFCLFELASNWEIQQDLIGEIRRFNKVNTHIDSLHDLVYLEAIVKETLRKYPPIPLVTKKPKKNFKSADLNIPENCLVFTSIFGIHHDPKNYLDAETFDPDRFLDDNAKSLKPNTYIPFGMDYRKTIGCSLTTMHIELCIFAILSSFKVTLTGGRKPVELDKKKLTTFPKEPLPLKFDLMPGNEW